MKTREIVEILRLSPLWEEFSFTERCKAVEETMKLLMERGHSIEKEWSIIDLVGEVYNG